MVFLDVKHHVYLLTPRPLSPSVPAEAGRSSLSLSTSASDSGESLHCFLVGLNKSYVIATPDL